MRQRAFTLIEALVVIAIIAILAALVFPVYNRAKKAGQQSVCLSNLGQIGKAIALYMADADDKWPFGVDPADKYTPQIWAGYPEFQRLLPQLPLMHDLLYPYVGSYKIWECPADRGQVVDDVSFEVLEALPRSFDRFGTSYYYRTEVTVRRLNGSSIPNLADVNIYFDGSGAWHTSEDLLRPNDNEHDRMGKLRKYRYNVLYGDLHLKNVTRDQYWAAWQISF